MRLQIQRIKVQKNETFVQNNETEFEYKTMKSTSYMWQFLINVTLIHPLFIYIDIYCNELFNLASS